MFNFEYYNPTKIIFGRQTLHRLLGELQGRNAGRILIVYGEGSIKHNSIYDSVTKLLVESGIEFVDFEGVSTNPTLSKVKEGIEVVRSSGCDSILAVGGGSVIDAAKVIAAGSFYDGDIWDGFENKITIEKALPIYVVLTCSASGSEMNAGAMITNEVENKKWPFVFSELLYPKVSIIDPEFQFSLSWRQTCLGAIDAISHVLEYYFNGVSDVDLQDDLSVGLIKTIIKHTIILKDNPLNYQSRAQLAWSCTMALNGMNATGRFGGDFASHTIEHSLSAIYKIPHAVGLAIIFPAWLWFVRAEIDEKLCTLGRVVFELDNAGVANTIESFRSLFESFGVETRLRQIGLSKKDFKELAANATIRGEIGRTRRLDEASVIEILELAY
ncbi:MAG TPA: iron-containing alcohol dehydrogenase [Paludibacter sp.]|nr:iron-containing alcohol dehydrogenase [Paludibacter sp.]